MDGFKIDASEVRSLAEDFRRVPPALARQAKPVVARGAVNIKNQLRDEMGKSVHFRAADSITYDLVDGGYGAEIGPTKGGAGDHPRTCGEHYVDSAINPTYAGSSPHMRGTPVRILCHVSASGIIPAHAGNT